MDTKARWPINVRDGCPRPRDQAIGSDLHQLPQELRDYLTSSRVALAIASPEGDNPLMFVNERFCALTGYASDEVVGQNCRFLQRDAENGDAKKRIHAFLADDAKATVRTDLINFRKDGVPFVNLLFMSKLRLGKRTEYLFASQFDISRTKPELLDAYDAQLAGTLGKMSPILQESGIVIDGSLMTVANSATTIAQARLMLASLTEAEPLG
jgi:PAS domain S-box-containing protein